METKQNINTNNTEEFPPISTNTKSNTVSNNVKSSNTKSTVTIKIQSKSGKAPPPPPPTEKPSYNDKVTPRAPNTNEQRTTKKKDKEQLRREWNKLIHEVNRIWDELKLTPSVITNKHEHIKAKRNSTILYDRPEIPKLDPADFDRLVLESLATEEYLSQTATETGVSVDAPLPFEATTNARAKFAELAANAKRTPTTGGSKVSSAWGGKTDAAAKLAQQEKDRLRTELKARTVIFTLHGFARDAGREFNPAQIVYDILTTHILEGITDDQRIEAIYQVDPWNILKWGVQFANSELAKSLQGKGGSLVRTDTDGNNIEFTLTSREPPCRVYITINATPLQDDQEFRSFLGQYGRVVKIIHKTYSWAPHIDSGKRQVILELSEGYKTRDLPTFMYTADSVKRNLHFKGKATYCTRCMCTHTFEDGCDLGVDAIATERREASEQPQTEAVRTEVTKEVQEIRKEVFKSKLPSEDKDSGSADVRGTTVENSTETSDESSVEQGNVLQEGAHANVGESTSEEKDSASTEESSDITEQISDLDLEPMDEDFTLIGRHKKHKRPREKNGTESDEGGRRRNYGKGHKPSPKANKQRAWRR